MPASNNSKQPHGNELHLYRQNMDYFFMTIAVSYGAVGLKMPIQYVNIVSEKQENGVWLWMIP